MGMTEDHHLLTSGVVPCADILHAEASLLPEIFEDRELIVERTRSG
jgi:hypothetical protein